MDKVKKTAEIGGLAILGTAGATLVTAGVNLLTTGGNMVRGAILTLLGLGCFGLFIWGVTKESK